MNSVAKLALSAAEAIGAIPRASTISSSPHCRQSPQYSPRGESGAAAASSAVAVRGSDRNDGQRSRRSRRHSLGRGAGGGSCGKDSAVSAGYLAESQGSACREVAQGGGASAGLNSSSSSLAGRKTRRKVRIWRSLPRTDNVCQRDRDCVMPDGRQLGWSKAVSHLEPLQKGRGRSRFRGIGRRISDVNRQGGERWVMPLLKAMAETVAHNDSSREEKDGQQQGDNKHPLPSPFMFSVNTLSLGGGGVEKAMSGALATEAGETGIQADHAGSERVVPTSVAPSTSVLGASLVATQPDARFSQIASSKSFNLATGILQGVIIAWVLNGLDPALLLVAALAGVTEALVENKEVQNLIEKLSVRSSRQLPYDERELQSILRKLENILENANQTGRLDVTALDKLNQQKLQSVLFLLKEVESDTKFSDLISQFASIAGLKSVRQSNDTHATPGVQSSKLAEANTQQREGQSPSLPFLANVVKDLVELTATPFPQLLGKTVLAGGLGIKNLLKPTTPSKSDLQALNLGEDAIAEWTNYVDAVPRDRVYVPLTVSSNVTLNKPFKVVVYGQPLVLFRPSPGEIAALPDTCPHRGASLSMGVLVTQNSQRCVKCPYHGLEFGPGGSCQKSNIHLNPVKVVETNGVVWIEEEPLTFEDAVDFDEDLSPFLRTALETIGFKGIENVQHQHHNREQRQQQWQQQEEEEEEEEEGEEEEGGNEKTTFEQAREDMENRFADAPFAAHFKMQGYSVIQGCVEIKAPPKAVVDNTFDLHHMHYVHATTFGGGQLLGSLQPNRNTILFEYGMRNSNPLRPFFGNGRVQVRMERMPPYSAMITVGDAQGKVQVKTLSHVVPTSANSSTLVWQLLRNFCTPEIFNPIFEIAVKRILSEDKAVLEGVDLRGIRKGMDLGSSSY